MAAVYGPHAGLGDRERVAFWTEFVETARLVKAEAANRGLPMIILGDLNLRFRAWGSSNAHSATAADDVVENLLTRRRGLGLQVLNAASEPTFYTGHILNYVFSKMCTAYYTKSFMKLLRTGCDTKTQYARCDTVCSAFTSI